MAGISHEKDDNMFVPLRKKPKLHGIESNYVNSVYEKSFTGDRMSELDIENLRWYNGIEVKGNINLYKI
jgi:hypothetical protein